MLVDKEELTLDGIAKVELESSKEDVPCENSEVGRRALRRNVGDDQSGKR